MIKKIKIFLILLILIVLSATALPGCKESGNGAEGNEVEFITISKGFYSMQPEEEYFIIKDEGGYNQLLVITKGSESDITNEAVDFSQDMVIGVFLGEKPTGGYEIEITGLVEHTEHMEVLIKIDEPDPGEIVTEAITSPYHIIKSEKSGKEIIFNIAEQG